MYFLWPECDRGGEDWGERVPVAFRAFPHPRRYPVALSRPKCLHTAIPCLPPWKPGGAPHPLNIISAGKLNHVSRRSPRIARLTIPRTPPTMPRTPRRTLQLPRRREASIPTRRGNITRWSGRTLPNLTRGAERKKLPIRSSSGDRATGRAAPFGREGAFSDAGANSPVAAVGTRSQIRNRSGSNQRRPSVLAIS